jgi:signal transduction histidine kinase/DNA-binding response OmpR family regulator
VNTNNLSLGQKLGLLLVVNTVIAVAMIAMVFTVGTGVSRYQDSQQQLEALARVVGENSRASLAFGDAEGARATLDGLRVRSDISFARLMDAQGNTFAQADFHGGHNHSSLLFMAALEALLPVKLTVGQSIQDDGRHIGQIELDVELHDHWSGLIEQMAVMVPIAIALSSLCVYFALRLRRIITDPILGLTRVAHLVSRKQDYSLRAVKAGNDEIAELVDHFNRMLSEIQCRDEALRQEREALVQLTSEMKLTMEAAESANRVKSEFLSTVSHELRTPLTAIGGSLGLLVGGVFGEMPAQASQMLQIAHKNSQRLSYLINDLLDMEKLAAGKLDFDMQPHQLMVLVRQALVDNEAYGSQMQVRYEVSRAAEEVCVLVDAQRLQQVMANLLSNAAKFSPAGSKVGVAVSQTQRGALVEVRDQGSGISPDFHDRIFQRFSQGDASDTRQKGGTGLGLAITRELVERMGGHIGFESMPDRGTCFYFELPLWTAATSSPVPLELPAPEAQKPRVLVVEDDADMASLISRKLNRAGYAVDIAETGAQALALAQKTTYAAVTLDLLLPDMDGLQLIDRLRAEQSCTRLPIVVISVTSNQTQPHIKAGLTNVEWLTRPIDLSKLLASMERLTATENAAKTRVLHVEDDLEMHQAVCAMAGQRFDFELATTLREARARVALERFEVVILDLTLPNESGWDLLPDIRAQQPDARVVVLSDSELSPDQTRLVDVALRKSQVLPRQLISAIDVRHAGVLCTAP